MADESAPGSPSGKELPAEVDVVVVGGGIAGVSAAYHLAIAGVRTLLVERERIGSGATGSAVGLLSPPMRQPFHETVHFRGEGTARRVWQFALSSVRGLAALLEDRGTAREAGLDLSGGYVLAERHTLHEVEASCRALERAGLPVEWLGAEGVRKLTRGRGFVGGFRIEGGGCIDPGRTVESLSGAAAAAGAMVVEETEVRGTRRERGFVYSTTDRGEVRSEMIVYATHVDSRRFSAFLGDEVVPIRGQGMVAAWGAPRWAGGFATHRKLNVWRSDGDRLALGGWRQDAWDRSYWKTRPALDERLQNDIQGWFESAFSDVGSLTIKRRWSGIFGWTADYLPLVGALPGRVGELVIAGFSGGGLPFAFDAGRVIASIVSEGEPVPGGELFNPRRFAS